MSMNTANMMKKIEPYLATHWKKGKNELSNHIIQGNRSIISTENFCCKSRHELLEMSIQFTGIQQVKKIIIPLFS